MGQGTRRNAISVLMEMEHHRGEEGRDREGRGGGV